MNLSGQTGLRDYLFDEIFLGRSETDGLLSHQFIASYGGFKTPTFFYRQAKSWMLSINATSSLPGLIPFRVFANAGIFDGAELPDITGNFSWEIGIDLPVIKDIFVLYFPFLYSNDIKYAIDQQKLSKGDLIRFELHLHKLNPIKLIKKY